jgi:hypothetical protein
LDIRQHGRYDYSPITERPDYDWPDGKRLAFYIGLNIEHFSFGEGLGHTPTNPGVQPDVRNFGWRDYGLRVGVWRIFDELDAFGLPACHLMNSAIYDYAPQIPERIRARGDEFVGHGRTNSEQQGDYDEAGERALIEAATGAFRRHEGEGPGGWMGPWISEGPTTPDLLKEAGYRFVMDWPCDDQPVWMRTRSGPLLSVPYHIEINDSPAMLSRRHTAPQFTEMVIDHFEEMLRLSEQRPLVCSLALHTFVTGQPARLVQFRRILEHITGHARADRVWFTRPGAIHDHIAALPPGTVPGDAGWTARG